jgi:hypothetical protein
MTPAGRRPAGGTRSLQAARPPIAPPSLLRASTTIVRRMPEMLLFACVVGGAIAVAGADDEGFLLPGIMVKTTVCTSAIVAMGWPATWRRASSTGSSPCPSRAPRY